MDSHLRNLTISLDGNSQHILTNSFKVYNQNHIIHLLIGRDKLNLDGYMVSLLEITTIRCDIKLWLVASQAVARNSHHVVNVDLGSIGQLELTIVRELVGYTFEFYDLFIYFEGWSYDMTLKCQSKHFRTAF